MLIACVVCGGNYIMSTVPLVLNPEIIGKTTCCNRQDAKLKKSCQDFEAILTGYMLKSMRKATVEGGFINKNMGERVFSEMLDDEYSKMISGTGKMGLADLLYKQLAGKSEETSGVDEAIRKYQNKNMHHYAPVKSLITDEVTNNKAVEGRNLEIAKKITKYNGLINVAARENRLDPNLIRAMIAQESAGNKDAVSSAGAKGLMQLMDSTASDIGVTDVFNPKENITAGSYYLRKMMDRYSQDVELALASYNAGPGAVDQYKGIPPYEETQKYVKSVLEYHQMFKNLYGG